MEGVLSGLAREQCLVYLDDVLVVGQTVDEHLRNLRAVFSCLAYAGLKLKPVKCRLMRKEVSFLGYIVSVRGVSADTEKVRAVLVIPIPCSAWLLRIDLVLQKVRSMLLSRRPASLPVRMSPLNGPMIATSPSPD